MWARWFLKSRRCPLPSLREITMGMLIGDAEASYCNLQMYFMVQQVILSHSTTDSSPNKT